MDVSERYKWFLIGATTAIAVNALTVLILHWVAIKLIVWQ